MLIMNVSLFTTSHLGVPCRVSAQSECDLTTPSVHARNLCALLVYTPQVKTSQDLFQYAYTFNNFNFPLSPKETTRHPLDSLLAGPSDASSVSSGSASPSGSATYYNEWD